MSIKIRNILISPDIVHSGLFTDEPYRGVGGRKTRRIFDLEKLLPVPEEVQADHSLQNEMRLMYYFMNGEMESEELPMDMKDTLAYDWLDRRENPEDLYRATRAYTADMSYQRKARFLEDGEALSINLGTYGALDWYEWRRANWGCTGNTSDLRILGDDEISFCTPDFPPKKAIQALAETLAPGAAGGACESDGAREGSSACESGGACEGSSDRGGNGAPALSHLWFPDEYGEEAPSPAGRCDYTFDEAGRLTVTETTYEKRDLFRLYYEYSANALDDRKIAAGSNDRLYFTMDAGLFKAFSDICRSKNVTVTQALTDMIGQTIAQNDIPFDMNKPYFLSCPKTGDASPRTGDASPETGKISHSNVRLPVRERGQFAGIVRQAGFSMNKVITTYMLCCLQTEDLPCTGTQLQDKKEATNQAGGIIQ